jgi:ABC-type lipoprotein release transport system permease subunit
MILLKIAWRNVWRHRGKSLTIGILLFLGAFFMSLGNATIQGARDGLRSAASRYTGHLVLVHQAERKQNVFTADEGLKVLPEYAGIKTVLNNQPYIAGHVPMSRGTVSMLNEDTGRTESWWVLGVDFEAYQQVFESYIVTEGVGLHTGGRGIMLHRGARRGLFRQHGYWLMPEGGTIDDAQLPPEAREWKSDLPVKHDIVLIGFSDDGFDMDVRVPLKGLFAMQNFYHFPYYLILDSESYRACFGYITASDKTVALSNETEALLEADDADTMFMETETVASVDQMAELKNADELLNATTHTPPGVNSEDGVYHLVAVKLTDAMSVNAARVQLREAFDKANVPVKVLTWKQALADEIQAVDIIHWAFIAFHGCVFVAAIIVIMNALSMAAIERIPEIGAMRAIGARKHAISRMFFIETLILAVLFGVSGIAAGNLAAWGIQFWPREGLRLSYFWMLILGGFWPNPIISIGGILRNVTQLAIVTLLAVGYPLQIAGKITPLDAVVCE